MYQLLDALVAQKHELVVFHLMGNNELELDYKGYSTLEDLETGEIIRTDAGKEVTAYQEKLEQYLTDLRSHLLDRGIFYRMIQTSEPVDQALRDFLQQRNKLKT